MRSETQISEQLNERLTINGNKTRYSHICLTASDRDRSLGELQLKNFHL